MRYIIIDDEPIAHDIIKKYADMLPDMQLLKHCYDALEALEFLKEQHIDLIFLDLNMPKLKGFDFLRTLPNPPKVIVTTAYKEYALEGYELNIIDYLLKPFSFERFLKAINKIEQTTEKDHKSDRSYQHQDSIFFYSDKKHIKVDLDEILFIEASGNYVKIVLKETSLLIRETLTNLVNKISGTNFIQVHKSFIVARSHIRKIEGNRITIQDHSIPVGRFYKSNLSKLLN